MSWMLSEPPLVASRSKTTIRTVQEWTLKRYENDTISSFWIIFPTISSESVSSYGFGLGVFFFFFLLRESVSDLISSCYLWMRPFYLLITGEQGYVIFGVYGCWLLLYIIFLYNSERPLPLYLTICLSYHPSFSPFDLQRRQIRYISWRPCLCIYILCHLAIFLSPPCSRNVSILFKDAELID